MSPGSLPRSHPRYTVQKITSYHYGGKRFLTITLDLGLGGMKIRTPRYLPEGECLNFKLVLGADSIWLRGKIIYSAFPLEDESVSGVQFIDLSVEDHALLRDYLALLGEIPKPRGMASAREDTGKDLLERKTAEE